MSVCRIIASDMPLDEFAPAQDYPLEIDIDKGIIWDGDADDNYYLDIFSNVHDYTDKKYGVSLEWRYTDGRANQIIKYIKSALLKAEVVEFWLVWLMDFYDFEDRPFIHRKTIAASELKVAHIKEIDNAIIWNTPDKAYPNRPSFYCLTVTR